MHINLKLFGFAAAACAAAGSASAQPTPAAPPAQAIKLDHSPLFAELDTNKDGKVTLAEWQAQKLSELPFGFLSQGGDYITLESFKAVEDAAGVDGNGDGKVTLAEFKAFNDATFGG